MKEVSKIIILFLFCLSSTAQEASGKVSMIGEDEKGYEMVISECSSLLLEVADSSMDKAYTLWTDMLVSMETKAISEGLDLRGTKIWINLFWAVDGTINKIVYYPKPNSKNMDFGLVTSFLEKFSNEYILPQEHTACFSHYGSASFPVHTKLAVQNEK